MFKHLPVYMTSPCGCVKWTPVTFSLKKALVKCAMRSNFFWNTLRIMEQLYGIYYTFNFGIIDISHTVGILKSNVNIKNYFLSNYVFYPWSLSWTHVDTV